MAGGVAGAGNSSPPLPTRDHVLSVDLLRGLFAFSIMFYHLFFGEKIAAVERVAFYAVYGFFVISGFSLYYVYRDRLHGGGRLGDYLLRRYFRIWPLYAFTVTLQLLFFPPALGEFAFPRVAANYLLLFGFTNPGATSLVGGGWSLGIEFVFYFLFPLIVFATAGSLRRMVLVSVISAAVSVGYANLVIDPQSSIFRLWTPYTQPQSFIVYFVAGCLFGELYFRFADKWRGHWVHTVSIAAALLPFLLVSADNSLNLISGWRGALLMAATLLLVFAAIFSPAGGDRFRRLATWFGNLSYAVYLLHPLVYLWLKETPIPAGAPRIVATVAVTVLAAWIVFVVLENPIRNWGRALTQRSKAAADAPK